MYIIMIIAMIIIIIIIIIPRLYSRFKIRTYQSTAYLTSICP